MTDTGTTGQVIGRTILLSSRLREIERRLREHGFILMTWPKLAIQPPESFAALDEAINNLFGYDWVILINEHAARFFLARLIQQGHEVSELDSLRVCAIAETTAALLEKTHVHVDVIATNVAPSAVVEQIARYVGGSESLRRLNVLIPQASIGRDYLTYELQEADARADVIIAYQTVAPSDATRLSALQTLLLTGSVDAVAFADVTDLSDLVRLFDTNDLGRLLKSVAVFVADKRAAMTATQMGVAPSLISESSSRDAMVEALLKRFPI